VKIYTEMERNRSSGVFLKFQLLDSGEPLIIISKKKYGIVIFR